MGITEISVLACVVVNFNRRPRLICENFETKIPE